MRGEFHNIDLTKFGVNPLGGLPVNVLRLLDKSEARKWGELSGGLQKFNLADKWFVMDIYLSQLICLERMLWEKYTLKSSVRVQILYCLFLKTQGKSKM